jgi:hypothetical protein
MLCGAVQEMHGWLTGRITQQFCSINVNISSLFAIRKKPFCIKIRQNIFGGVLMSKRATGVTFIFIAAFLYGIRYLAAGMFGSSITSWNEDLFKAMLNAIGNGPTRLSTISLVVGILYIVLSEFEPFLNKNNKK